MKNSSRLLICLLMLLCAASAAAPLAQAQKQKSVSRASSQSNIKRMRGASGVAITKAVMNLAAVARREALTPPKAVAPKAIHAPGRPVDDGSSPAAAAPFDKAAQDDALASLNAPGEPLGPAPAPLSTFQALTDSNQSIPPDTHGAVGPNHVMTVLNTQIRIQDRNGVALSTVSLDGFWASLQGPDSTPPDTFDPKLLYDPYGQRWMFTVVANARNASSSTLIGVSQTTDPTGAWNLFRVDTDSTDLAWADYPSLGFNKDWIVVQVNLFPNTSAQSIPNRSQILVFSKSDLYAGSGAGGTGNFRRFNIATANQGFTLVPAITHDANLSTMYLVAQPFGSSTLRVSTITGAVGSEVLSAPAPALGSGFTWLDDSNADFAPQLGSNARISANDSRIQNVVYRNGSLWTAHDIYLPSAGANRTGVQWWQINPVANTVTQRGVIQDPAGIVSYSFGSIAVNKDNDALVGYSRFSALQYASANYSFRRGSDPLGAMRDDVVFKAGEAPYFKTFGGSSNRWGDYSSTVVDPADDTDMWTVQQYAAAPVNGSSRWATWWARVRADGTAPPPAPAPTPAPTPVPPASNNSFGSPVVLNGITGSIAGNNLGASKEANEPSHGGDPGGRSVWYQWQAPASGPAAFFTAGSNFDTTLSVYTGGAVGALTTIGSNDDAIPGASLHSGVTFDATAGTIYRIAVDGFAGDVGQLVLTWGVSINDNFVNAQTLGGSSGSVGGSNLAATKEGGEPNHGGNPGGKSLWYRWQAPSTESATVTTLGSSFDTLLGVYTGNSVGTLTPVGSNDDNSDGTLTSRVTFNATAGTTYYIAVDGFNGTSNPVLPASAESGSIAINYRMMAVTPANTIQFSTAAINVSEGTTSVEVTVNRTGNTSGAATVKYATGNGSASDTSDYIASLGTLRFAPGETSKSFTIFITDDSFIEGAQTVNLTLSEASGATLGAPSNATLTISSNDGAQGTNPLDNSDAQFFVRQHYQDFFSRDADAAGLGFWTNQITSCGADTACIAARRINVSAAFFLSIEFQETGFLVYRFHQAAFNTGPLLRLRNFLPDTQEIGKGVVIGQPGAEAQLEANKQAFADEFVTRPAFTALYPSSMPADQFIDALNFNTGGVLSTDERNSLVTRLANNSINRAQALREVAEDSNLRVNEFNRAFVYMQYVGYLRRNPDDADDNNLNGYNFWLGKLNQFNGNFVDAEMVKAFITSGEYRRRFGPE